ncbi:hypothetical protein C8R44DRAFT_744254 [Mycena epipterygia]|nr:hypothetical protein C8R44DRAFT_744254 [Mycena epipterygia]
MYAATCNPIGVLEILRNFVTLMGILLGRIVLIECNRDMMESARRTCKERAKDNRVGVAKNTDMELEVMKVGKRKEIEGREKFSKTPRNVSVEISPSISRFVNKFINNGSGSGEFPVEYVPRIAFRAGKSNVKQKAGSILVTAGANNQMDTLQKFANLSEWCGAGGRNHTPVPREAGHEDLRGYFVGECEDRLYHESEAVLHFSPFLFESGEIIFVSDNFRFDFGQGGALFRGGKSAHWAR